MQNRKISILQLCQPMKSLIILRHNFNTKQQKEGKSFKFFSHHYNTKRMHVSLVQWRTSVWEPHWSTNKQHKDKDLLFAGSKLTLQRAIEICELRENAAKTAQELKMSQKWPLKSWTIKKAIIRVKRKQPKCKNCSYNHAKSKCPAF